METASFSAARSLVLQEQGENGNMSKPNIILISCDHMRSDMMGVAGHPCVQTPHIDYLARRGVRFANAFSPQPACIPARATIMTGLEGSSLGLTYYKEGQPLPDTATMPSMLSDAGYETRAVGKMHFYPERKGYGFQSMVLCEEGRPIGKYSGKFRGYDDYEQWLQEQGYPGEAFSHGMSNNEFHMSPWHLPDEMHPTEWIGTQACKTVKNRDWTKPLFMWVSFTAPHPPITPLARDLMIYEHDEIPEPVVAEWSKRQQPMNHERIIAAHRSRERSRTQNERVYRGVYALVTQIDRQINRLLGTLREEGMTEDTWIVFTSDHGDSLGDHYLWAKTNFMKGSCQVPLIVSPPGPKKNSFPEDWTPGSVVNTPVGLQDIFPTCLAIAGIEPPKSIDGESLFPLVERPATGKLEREMILGEYGRVGSRSFMVTDGRMKYIWFEKDGRELLFDTENDPNETEELSNTHPEQAKLWRQHLIDRLSQRQSEPCLQGNDLVASDPGAVLTERQQSFVVPDFNPRGLHR